MAQAQRIVTHSIDSLRRLMVDLYPPDLDSHQLPATLGNLTVPLQEKGLSVTTELDELPELDNASVTTLYRVAREALANVAEHSQASAVRVSLQSLDHPSTGEPLIRLVIRDDGVGLDHSRLDRRADGHLGLRLLRDRVENVGGEFELRDDPEGGTQLRVELPVVSGA
jgi:two-component system NarL family sensor kinase